MGQVVPWYAQSRTRSHELPWQSIVQLAFALVSQSNDTFAFEVGLAADPIARMRIVSCARRRARAWSGTGSTRRRAQPGAPVHVRRPSLYAGPRHASAEKITWSHGPWSRTCGPSLISALSCSHGYVGDETTTGGPANVQGLLSSAMKRLAGSSAVVVWPDYRAYVRPPTVATVASMAKPPVSSSALNSSGPRGSSPWLSSTSMR